MDSRQLIDAQFNRAVEIVQGLPKTGPIQTGYEEKLTMYSLYKQATIGNVTGPRPGIFDMLGRAKWDAWAKHKDLDQHEAKWLYVDALLKALSKYSDKTVARDLIDELHSYGGDTSNLVSSYTLTRTGSRGSSSSSAATEDHATLPPPHLLQDLRQQSVQYHPVAVDNDENSEDEEAGDESCDLPVAHDVFQHQRPLSSVSFSSRYKTPLAGSRSHPSPPPRRSSVPPTQPLPNFETISAFGDPATGPSAYASSASFSGSTRDLTQGIQSAGPPYKRLSTSRPSTITGAHPRPPSRAISVSLEHAMENMQAHLAALTERVDTLESSLATHSHPHAPGTVPVSSHSSSGRGSPANPRSVPQPVEWDVDDMGLWTLVLKPLLRNFSFLHRLLVFFLTSDQDRSPLQIVVRRLCLDISFVMVVVGALRAAWKKSGTRRKEVGAALVLLWGAITGRGRIPGGRYLRL